MSAGGIPETVPGGFVSGRDALTGLVQISATEAVVRDALTRANHMVSTLTSMLGALGCERKDAIRAIDLFAEVAPSSFGVPAAVGLSTDGRAEVEEGLSAIEAAVGELLRQREGEAA